jgi:prephenate dehydrogenase
MKKEIAIIGYGRFGKLVAHYLKIHFKVSVYDSDLKLKLEPRIKRCTIDDLKLKNVVVLAVPINKLQSALKDISPFLKSSSIVVDVCSVKEQPIKWMKKYLPKQTSIIGTHPLFGPDSVRNNLKGKNIIICPERISKFKLHKISNLLSSFGLSVTMMSPKKHDKLMASTLFLTQFIGRGLKNHRLDEQFPQTENFKKLEQVIRSSNSDSIELFFDMYRYNRYAKRIPAKIIGYLMKLKQAIDENNHKNRNS